MKKIVLSALIFSSFVSFGQWAITGNNSAEDCISAFGKVYASSTATNDSLRVSTNEGLAWALSNTGIPASTPISLATVHNGTLMVAFSKNTNKIYTSTNGSTWVASTTTAFGSNGISGICSIGGSTLLACVSSTAGTIYASTNNGSTWSLKSTPAAGKLATCIEYMNGGVFVGYSASPKVMVSTNAGSTFTTVNTGILASDTYVTAFGNVGVNLFCGTALGRIYTSTNMGTSWSPVHQVSTATSFFHFINDFYTLGTSIYCATDTGFVYSTNLGTSWNMNNTGFNTGNFEHQLLRVTSSTNYFIVSCKATSGKIMRRPITQIVTGIAENTLSEIKTIAYPNPSSDLITIEVPGAGSDMNYEIKINDILGREIGTYVLNDAKVTLNVSSYNKGLYFYSVLNNKNAVMSSKFVVE